MLKLLLEQILFFGVFLQVNLFLTTFNFFQAPNQVEGDGLEYKNKYMMINQ